VWTLTGVELIEIAAPNGAQSKFKLDAFSLEIVNVHSNMYRESVARLIQTEFIEPLMSKGRGNKTLIEEFDHGSD
jgi:hypothetical protein